MHTPGPWEWVENKFRGGYNGIVGANGEEVLFPNHCNDGDEGDAWFEDFPSEADRRLIAAAPDLLEVLKELDSLLDFTDPVPNEEDGAIAFEDATQINEAFQKALTIMAKAEGVEA